MKALQTAPTPASAATLFKKPRHAFDHRRMAVVKSGVNGMWMEIGEVLPGEFHQRGGERARRAAQLRCEPVGFPLVPSG